MGNPKQKWTREEEEALRRGVAKYGAGKWKNIHQDPEFGPALHARSNIDLKDKWRNLSVASGQITRDKSKAKAKNKNAAALPVPPIAQVSVSQQTHASVTPMSVESMTDVVMSDSSKLSREKNYTPHHIPMIFKIDEQPQTKNPPPTVIKREPQQVPNRNVGNITYTIDQAALWAASKVAEAENTAFVAAESMREAERISAMAEEMEALVQFARDCLDTSTFGDVLLVT